MIRRTSEQWLALFDQCKASGLTQTEFAKQHGIDPSYFQPSQAAAACLATGRQ